MNELRMILVAALCGVVFTACGDDDIRVLPDGGPRDLGPRDMNTTPVDQGPPVDLGPGTDSGNPDLGPAGSCPAGPCDLLTNGCPSGEACYFLSSSATTAPEPLCQAGGIGMSGAACTTYSDCASGFMCVGAAGSTPGTCVKLCCDLNSSAGCPAGASCSITLTYGSGTPTGAGLCHAPANCSIFGTDCPSGEACTPFGGDGTTDCSEPGTLTAGQACHYANDCVPGFGCVGPSGSSVCRKLCNTDAGGVPACTGTDVCTSLGIPAPLANVGACLAAP